MQNTNLSRESARFGVFELDLRAGELRKQGLRIKLQEKPFQVLALLLERPGELVTREELQKKLWPGDTFVDFDHSMNTAVNKLREALGDSAESPRFIETLPKRGYRFIAPVQGLSRAEAAPAVGSRARQRPAIVGVVAALVVVLGLAAYLGWTRWGRRATPPEGRIMLAVLPFENLSGDPEQEYFSDGITEEMISQLGQVHPERLGVIARTSAMQYKKTNKRVDQIGRELGVDYVVEGSVRRANERVRVTAQLIQVSDQTKIWSDSYESALGDVLALQNEVAGAIAAGIQLKLTPQQQAHLARARPVKAEAYEAYLRGRFYWSRRTDDGLRKAIQEFDRSIGVQPDYAPAYAGLADAYFSSGFWGVYPPLEVVPKGQAAARRGVELDETLPEAHTAMALAYLWDKDLGAVEREFQRALELNPGYAQAHLWYGDHLASIGREEESAAERRRARELDPLSVWISNVEGFHLFLARRYDDAIKQFLRTLEYDPNYALPHYELGRAYEEKGMYGEALREFQRARELSPDNPLVLAGLGNCYGRMGNRREAVRVLADLKALAGRRYVSPLYFAHVYVGLGEKEQAFAWLEKSYQERAGHLRYLKVDPIYDPLRSDPRFAVLMKRTGFLEQPR